jgi:predicted dehydrogenase
MTKRTRYVLAGTGSRGLGFFGQSLMTKHREQCELVGLFDISTARMNAANQMLGSQLPVYTNFQKMLTELAPDGVIIATNDASHAEYVIQTLEAGSRVICEKPLGIDADQVSSVLTAARRFANDQRANHMVTHNMRYSPAIVKIRSLLTAGAIGQILTISFQETLDRRHGADYFRRWHRFRENSGGLLIQKGCHHFDVLNWLAGARPRQVIARGGLYFYGQRGPFRGERCQDCAQAARCEFYADIWATSEKQRQLYREAEHDSGYIRDGCVFDERIDIEDHMVVFYDYENGVQVDYRLTAFASFEGVRIEIEGTGGRIVYEGVYPTDWPPGNVVVPGLETFKSQQLVLYSFSEGVVEFPTEQWTEEWDTDRRDMLPEIFDRPLDAPLTDRLASLEDGAWAVLVGAAANRSIAEESRPIDVSSLLQEGII